MSCIGLSPCSLCVPDKHRVVFHVPCRVYCVRTNCTHIRDHVPMKQQLPSGSLNKPHVELFILPEGARNQIGVGHLFTSRCCSIDWTMLLFRPLQNIGPGQSHCSTHAALTVPKSHPLQPHASVHCARGCEQTKTKSAHVSCVCTRRRRERPCASHHAVLSLPLNSGQAVGCC